MDTEEDDGEKSYDGVARTNLAAQMSGQSAGPSNQVGPEANGKRPLHLRPLQEEAFPKLGLPSEIPKEGSQSMEDARKRNAALRGASILKRMNALLFRDASRDTTMQGATTQITHVNEPEATALDVRRQAGGACPSPWDSHKRGNSSRAAGTIGSTVKISEKHLAWACRSDPAPRRSRESGDRWRFAQIVSAVYKNAGRDVDSYVMLLAPESTVLDAHGRVVPSIADSKEAEVITMKANEFHEYVCESHAEVPALCARAQRDAEAKGNTNDKEPGMAMLLGKRKSPESLSESSTSDRSVHVASGLSTVEHWERQGIWYAQEGCSINVDAGAEQGNAAEDRGKTQARVMHGDRRGVESNDDGGRAVRDPAADPRSDLGSARVSAGVQSTGLRPCHFAEGRGCAVPPKTVLATAVTAFATAINLNRVSSDRANDPKGRFTGPKKKKIKLVAGENPIEPSKSNEERWAKIAEKIIPLTTQSSAEAQMRLSAWKKMEGGESSAVDGKWSKWSSHVSCGCKKSRCLRQYCVCFRAEKQCSAECVCVDCHNDGNHEENLLAAKKEMKVSVRRAGFQGCRCKNSGCVKKYCECYSQGSACSAECLCIDCMNRASGEDGLGVQHHRGTEWARVRGYKGRW